MLGHGSFGVGAVDFAADAHGLVALAAEQLIFGLFVVAAEAEVKDRLLAERFAFVLAGDLVLVVFIVALFAKVGFFSEAVMGGDDVLAALADNFLNKG